MPAGGGLARVENPAAVAALKLATRRCLGHGGEPVLTALSPEAAQGFPSYVSRPAWGARCWLMLTLDPERRIAFTTTWAAGPETPEREAALIAPDLLNRLRAWASTPGFGTDFATKGRA